MRPIQEDEAKALCEAANYRNGQDYFQKGKVSDTWQSANSLHAQVAGSGAKPYQVSVVEEGGKLRPRCTCPAHRRQPFCKHVAAVLVAYTRAPERFVAGEVQAAPEVARPRRAAQPKVDRRQVQAAGLARIEELLVELTSYGLLSLNEALVARVQDQVQAAESHKLRRLARLLGQIAAALATALQNRSQFDEAAYAELLSDAWLTVQATRKAQEDPRADPAALEDLVGKTWRESELERHEGVQLLELAYETVQLATGFIVDTSYLWSLDDGVLYTEKQIVPAALRGQSRKPSYSGRLAGTIGLYPGQEPRRVKLIAMAPETPPAAADWERALAHADRTVDAAVQRFQAVTTNPLALPESYALLAPARVLVEGPAVYLLDGGGQGLPLVEGWRILGHLTQGPVAAVFGRTLVVEGELRLVPLGLVTAPPQARLVRCV